MPFAPTPSLPAAPVHALVRGRYAIRRGEVGMSRAHALVTLEIGARIRRRRRSLGATLTEIGRRAGISYQQLQRFECGETQISAAMVWRLAEALGVSVHHLFGETTAPEPGPSEGRPGSARPEAG